MDVHILSPCRFSPGKCMFSSLRSFSCKLHKNVTHASSLRSAWIIIIKDFKNFRSSHTHGIIFFPTRRWTPLSRQRGPPSRWEKDNTVSMTASEVLKVLDYDNPSRAQATRMGNILMKLTGKTPQRRKHTLPRRKPAWA